MKYLVSLVSIILVIIIIAPVVSAMTGDTVKTIPSPYNCPQGLTFDGKNLWCVDRKSDMIYRVDISDGKILDSLPSPGYTPRGLTWDGKLLWTADVGEERIFAINPKTGIVEKTIYCPVEDPNDLTFDGQYLWLADPRGDELLRISTEDGTTITSLPSPSSNPCGLTFDGTYLWVSDRSSNMIYMVTVDGGDVIISFDSPGPHSWGLAWDGKYLWNVDYETDRIYEIKIRDEGLFSRTDSKKEILDFTHQVRNFGPDTVVTLDVYLAVPVNMNNQQLLEPPRFNPQPTEIIPDQWGQKVAHFHFENVPAGDFRTVGMDVRVELFKNNYFVFPDKVGTLSDIPKDTLNKYLVDDAKYSYTDEYIQSTVKKVVGDEDNVYWIARKIFRYIIDNMEYELAGGWNLAPTVLKRGTGSCSEYSFVYISMCRAAGLPARYVGAVTIRGDDASYDDVFHRWVEVFMPGYGWIPIDPSGGDQKWPAYQANAFGKLNNRYLITTSGGGGSKYLDWSYNSNEKWTSKGKCRIEVENIAEWSPLTENDMKKSASMNEAPVCPKK